jgi:hypothetical protein
LLRVLQVKQCEEKINKNLQYYLTKRKYHTRVAKSTKNAPRTPRDPPKLHFIAPRKVTKWHQNYKRKMGENEREWRDILV